MSGSISIFQITMENNHMKRLFISLLLFIPFVLIQGKGSSSDEHLERSEQEYLDGLAFLEKIKLACLEKNPEIKRKKFLKLRYQCHRNSLESKIRVYNLCKEHNALGLHNLYGILKRSDLPVKIYYLEKEIVPDIVKDIDYDPNNEAIILDTLCRDPEETGNDSDEVKNEKVSTCKANFIKLISECRKRMKKIEEDNQEK